MAYDASNLIDKECIPGLCPFCDNAIEAFDSCRVVEAHGLRFLVHEICLDTAEDEEDEDNDEPDTDPENIYGLASIRQSIEEDRRR